MGTTMIGVAVVEDHPLSRQNLMDIVEASSAMELVTTASSVGEMEDAGYDGVHVVLLDFHLPDAEGKDAVSRVKARVIAVLVISASNDHQNVIEAIGAGANGYLSKGAHADEVMKAVTAVSQGGAYVSPVLAAHLLRNAREELVASEFALSDADREILSLVAQGETNAAIARQFSIDVDLVRSRLDRIRERTELGHRAHLMHQPPEERATRESR